MSANPEPVSNLDSLLGQLSPIVRPGRFVFTAPHGQASASEADHTELYRVSEALVREPEGVSVVLREEAARRLGYRFDSVWAWITLQVPSDLEAVGMTAAVSTALARAGLSCNVIAGLRHDHLLVPHERAGDALYALTSPLAGR